MTSVTSHTLVPSHGKSTIVCTSYYIPGAFEYAATRNLDFAVLATVLAVAGDKIEV